MTEAVVHGGGRWDSRRPPPLWVALGAFSAPLSVPVATVMEHGPRTGPSPPQPMTGSTEVKVPGHRPSASVRTAPPRRSASTECPRSLTFSLACIGSWVTAARSEENLLWSRDMGRTRDPQLPRDRPDRHLLGPVQPADLRPVLHADHPSSRPDSTSQTPWRGQLSSADTGPLFSRRRQWAL